MSPQMSDSEVGVNDRRDHERHHATNHNDCQLDAGADGADDASSARADRYDDDIMHRTTQ